MKNVIILAAVLMLFIISCKSKKEENTEKFQKYRDNIVNVKNEIVDIKSEIIFGNSVLNIIDNFIVVTEIAPSSDKGIHLFDKQTFNYATSTAIVGRGAGEVARQGRVGVDSKNRILWSLDYGKNVMWKFPLDSVLNNKKFKPTEKFNLCNDLFVERFGFLNDNIVLGKAVRILSNSSFDMITAKLNTNTNVTKQYGYEHPEAVGKLSNSMFKLSVKDSLYVNCYVFIDLISICDLNGKLKFNIYGNDFSNKKKCDNAYFDGVDIYKNYIIASYVGDKRIVYDEFKRREANLPSKIQIFNMDGDYVKTLETGHKFSSFCVDEENKRLIIYFSDRENPLGYINLDLN